MVIVMMIVITVMMIVITVLMIVISVMMIVITVLMIVITDHYTDDCDDLSVDAERITVAGSCVEVVIVLQPVVLVRHADTPEAALAQEAVALGGLQVGAEHAEEDQRRQELHQQVEGCLLYTSPSPRDS